MNEKEWFACDKCGAVRYGTRLDLGGRECGVSYTTRATWDDTEQQTVCEGLLVTITAPAAPPSR